MANSENIKPHQFTSEKQPKKRRSRKGIPNRATVYKTLLDLVVHAADPRGRGVIELTLYEAMALGQIRAAMRGNTRAWIEIQDSLFGKQITGINVNVTAEALKQLSDEELDDLMKQCDRGYVKTQQITIIEARQQFEDRRDRVRREIAELDDDGP